MSRSNRRSVRKKRRKPSKERNILIILLLSVIIAICCIYLFFFKNSSSVAKSKQLDNIPTKVEEKKHDPISPEKEPEIPQPKLSEIVISSAGDCTIGTDPSFGGNTLPVTLKSNDMDLSYFFKNVKKIFEKDDMTLVNLETTFTTYDKKEPKAFNFKGDPSYAKSLTLGSIEAVNISNNHIYDYKQKGFDDTLSALKAENINYFGEGNIYKTDIKGLKFAMLGYQAWGDSFNFDKLKNTLQELKSENYTVIINFHWGIERDYTPSSFQKKLAHFAIDNGADVIIGHHPHVLQSIETYKNKFICYSLGNFCFGGNSNPSDKDSAIVQNTFKYENDKLVSIGIRIIPCSISSVKNRNDYCPTPLSGEEYTRVIKKLTKISPDAGFNLSDEYHFQPQE
ncbi:poly-gamma-glutamate synthesis protein (capsule biosynthesis protein) [Hathewaya proteolytica DSM 3090]|uniref:Poly-gamma-glutamate synthesis protein (Capsule biosynthesis protein) n=1 Tax=Hathewaya proteolytica DSM 3090 TaxID=1121331 RepID=A0A1M6KND2_9CLOT|nr:CapA family protein [Hathewaya proteolytica]SHJ60508.1 poly-gamma-glutamate synthesis protein (capsule biosynthesis protein) [Hathewaya proteolytica DSM 3090]